MDGSSENKKLASEDIRFFRNSGKIDASEWLLSDERKFVEKESIQDISDRYFVRLGSSCGYIFRKYTADEQTELKKFYENAFIGKALVSWDLKDSRYNEDFNIGKYSSLGEKHGSTWFEAIKGNCVISSIPLSELKETSREIFNLNRYDRKYYDDFEKGFISCVEEHGRAR